jgi:hypothetical protein
LIKMDKISSKNESIKASGLQDDIKNKEDEKK